MVLAVFLVLHAAAGATEAAGTPYPTAFLRDGICHTVICDT